MLGGTGRIACGNRSVKAVVPQGMITARVTCGWTRVTRHYLQCATGPARDGITHIPHRRSHCGREDEGLHRRRRGLLANVAACFRPCQSVGHDQTQRLLVRKGRVVHVLPDTDGSHWCVIHSGLREEYETRDDALIAAQWFARGEGRGDIRVYNPGGRVRHELDEPHDEKHRTDGCPSGAMRQGCF